MTVLYIFRDMRSLPLFWLTPDTAPRILHIQRSNETELHAGYLLTPILYAALERHTDALDNLFLAGRLTLERIKGLKTRLEGIRKAANELLDWNLVAKAREALACQSEPLLHVLERYSSRMGGEREVERLRQEAEFDPRFLGREAEVGESARHQTRDVAGKKARAGLPPRGARVLIGEGRGERAAGDAGYTPESDFEKEEEFV